MSELAEHLRIVAGILHDEGFRAEIREASNFIASGAAGLNFVANVHLASVQLRSSVPGAPKTTFGVEGCNRFNHDYRVAKAYIDGDGDVMIEADHFVSPLDPAFAPSFKAVLALWENLLGLLKQEVAHAPPRPAPGDGGTTH